MYVQASVMAANGVTFMYHRLSYIQAYPDSARVIVRSYSAPDQAMIGWEQMVDIPLTALSSDWTTSVGQYLIGDGQYLAGGSIIQE